MVVVQLEMEPQSGEIDLSRTALLIIDMQRDFLEPKGFGEMLGNDVSKLQRAIEPCRRVLETVRDYNNNNNNNTDQRILIIHTREGHRTDMTNVHSWKLDKHGTTQPAIGQDGPMGRILIQGEPGHDIIPQLYPKAGDEVLIDKPGKGAFYSTDLQLILQANRIQTLLICGVTTEVCVQSTIREGNDRGYHCICLRDACSSYNDEFHTMAIQMIIAQGGIFGSTTTTDQFISSISNDDDTTKNKQRNNK